MNVSSQAAEPERKRHDRERERIRDEYASRSRRLPPDRYSKVSPGEVFMRQQREWHVIALLAAASLLPLARRRILDVGCGEGQWLVDLETWGATRSALAGIDLLPERVAVCARRVGGVGGADIREGDATELPWPDQSFDLVLQSMVCSSILSPEMRSDVAREMLRVVRPGGAVLWNDFCVDNPRNKAIHGISRGELTRLFPGTRIVARRITLAQPIARRVVPVSRAIARGLEALKVLNVQYVALVVKPPS